MIMIYELNVSIPLRATTTLAAMLAEEIQWYAKTLPPKDAEQSIVGVNSMTSTVLQFRVRVDILLGKSKDTVEAMAVDFIEKAIVLVRQKFPEYNLCFYN